MPNLFAGQNCHLHFWREDRKRPTAQKAKGNFSIWTWHCLPSKILWKYEWEHQDTEGTWQSGVLSPEWVNGEDMFIFQHEWEWDNDWNFFSLQTRHAGWPQLSFHHPATSRWFKPIPRKAISVSILQVDCILCGRKKREGSYLYPCWSSPEGWPELMISSKTHYSFVALPDLY